MDSPENLTAFAADDDLRKTMVAAEGPLFPTLAGMNTATPDQLLLNLHEDFSRDDAIIASITSPLASIELIPSF